MSSFTTVRVVAWSYKHAILRNVLSMKTMREDNVHCRVTVNVEVVKKKERRHELSLIYTLLFIIVISIDISNL